MWWLLLWVVLIVAAAGITAWLGWRVWLAVKGLFKAVAEVEQTVAEVQAEATAGYGRWEADRLAHDEEYHAELAEQARPVPANLTIPASIMSVGDPDARHGD